MRKWRFGVSLMLSALIGPFFTLADGNTRTRRERMQSQRQTGGHERSGAGKPTASRAGLLRVQSLSSQDWLVRRSDSARGSLGPCPPAYGYPSVSHLCNAFFCSRLSSFHPVCRSARVKKSLIRHRLTA